MAETTLAAANVSITHDKARNLSRFLELIDEAGAAGADVLVLPEMGFGYSHLLDAVGQTFEQLTGSRELLLHFGIRNTRRVLCWDKPSG